jgi:hypothetical protein
MLIHFILTALLAFSDEFAAVVTAFAKQVTLSFCLHTLLLQVKVLVVENT